MQLTHYNTKFTKKTFPITLVCDNVTNTTNIGSLFRICDAFGIEKLILCGEHINLGRKISKTSRATEKTVNYSKAKCALEEVKTLKSKNYSIISLEITTNSTPIHEFLLTNKNSVALVIGDENFGVSEEILKLSDSVIHIDMYGKNSSMNVVQAANIALYEFSKHFL